MERQRADRLRQVAAHPQWTNLTRLLLVGRVGQNINNGLLVFGNGFLDPELPQNIFRLLGVARRALSAMSLEPLRERRSLLVRQQYAWKFLAEDVVRQSQCIHQKRNVTTVDPTAEERLGARQVFARPPNCWIVVVTFRDQPGQ